MRWEARLPRPSGEAVGSDTTGRRERWGCYAHASRGINDRDGVALPRWHWSLVFQHARREHGIVRYMWVGWRRLHLVL